MIRQKILCEWLNLHVGYPEMQPDSSMMFYCTRCESYNHPITPAETERITRQMYEEEGYGYDKLHDNPFQKDHE